MDPSTNDQPKITDAESAAVRPRKKSMKCLAYVAAFAVFQTVVILAFSLAVMKVRNPSFSFRSIALDNFSLTSSTSPSFAMRLEAELALKNTNFGHYDYENSTISLAYGGTKVGEASISKGRARARSSREIEVAIDVTSTSITNNSNLATDLNSGILILTSHGRLYGKVHLLGLFKKKKSPQMNCTININLVYKQIQVWNCN